MSRSRSTSRPSARRKETDRKSTRLNSSHLVISYAVFCLKKKKKVPHGGTPRLPPERILTTHARIPARAPFGILRAYTRQVCPPSSLHPHDHNHSHSDIPT